MIGDPSFELPIREPGILAKIPSDGARRPPDSGLLCIEPEDLLIESEVEKAAEAL
jgi:hypothetical protein